MGGKCEVDGDCQSQYQTVPGTGCSDGQCECMDPLEHICCSKGETALECFLSCRPCSECAVGTEGCPSGCQRDEECPGPPDARCGAGRCVQGDCQLEILAGPLASQVRGDCAQLQCTVSGEVEAIMDVGDLYDDGKQCTYDSCGAAGPLNEPLPDGLTCPVSSFGRCSQGRCVECFAADQGTNDCATGKACDGEWCVPAHCVNNVFDPGLGETTKNCGGPCRPCDPGDTCASAADCLTEICTMGTCKVPTCSDGVHNDAETGIDCGAPSCPLCSPGQGCETGADCTSGVCWVGVCEDPSCYDGLRNGEEAGVDCGPSCGSVCP